MSLSWKCCLQMHPTVLNAKCYMDIGDIIFTDLPCQIDKKLNLRCLYKSVTAKKVGRCNNGTLYGLYLDT